MGPCRCSVVARFKYRVPTGVRVNVLRVNERTFTTGSVSARATEVKWKEKAASTP